MSPSTIDEEPEESETNAEITESVDTGEEVESKSV